MTRAQIVKSLYNTILDYAMDHENMSYDDALRALVREYMQLAEYGMELLTSKDHDGDWMITIDNEHTRSQLALIEGLAKNRKTMYVATPYGAIAKHVKDPKEAHRIAVDIATRACEKAIELGYIPFSPVLNFNNVYDEYKRPGDREKALEAGFLWLDQCDCLGWAETLYSDSSVGMKAEERRAYDTGKQVIPLEGV